MIIQKVLNTSFVLVDDEGTEKVIMGKGIGFSGKKGEKLKPEFIQHIFSPDMNKSINTYVQLIKEIPETYFELTKRILTIIEEKLEIHLDSHLFIGLTDHIYYAIDRFKKGIVIQNRLLWEIKAFYKKEFDIGCTAIDLINKELNVQLCEEEAGNIAYYIVTASHHTNMERTIESIELQKEILSIINLSFKGSFKVDSIPYQRLVTHLQFFIQRLQENKILSGDDSMIFDLYRNKYPEVYECVRKITQHIQKKLKIDIGVEELSYLLIHITRNILP